MGEGGLETIFSALHSLDLSGALREFVLLPTDVRESDS